MRKFNGLVQNNRIRCYMNIIYVDDQSWAGRALRRGVRWDMKKGEMRWRIKWEEQDRESGEGEDVRT